MDRTHPGSPQRARPVPYHGHRIERIARLGTSYVSDRQDGDASGRVRYAFNSLGYRGPEYRADAKCTTFVFGESEAFGLGVELEECWTSLVVQRWLADRGVDASSACTMNFAESGVSNAHIARMVVTQCSALRPDLVVVQLADPGRTEGLVDGRAFPVGSWLAEDATEASVLGLPVDDPLRSRLVDQLRRGRQYLEFTNPQHARLDALRHLLFMQWFLALHAIPCLLAVPSGHDPVSDRDGDPLLAPLRAQVDPRSFVCLPLGIEFPVVDRAADGLHLGPRTHAEMARRAHEFLRKRDGLRKVGS